tara:strand:- start:97 stop:198 length:102 start_codon:yes stop_codon:yes gene_type:complete
MIDPAKEIDKIVRKEEILRVLGMVSGFFKLSQF